MVYELREMFDEISGGITLLMNWIAMARLLAQDTSLNRDRLGSPAGRRKNAHDLK